MPGLSRPAERSATTRARRAVALAALLCALHAACAASPRGWEAARLDDRPATQRPQPAPRPALRPTLPPAPVVEEGRDAGAAPSGEPVCGAADAAGDADAWVVSVHAGWLLLLALACGAAGYAARALQHGAQLPQGRPALPAPPGRGASVGGEELRLGRAAAEADAAGACSVSDPAPRDGAGQAQCSAQNHTEASGAAGQPGDGEATAGSAAGANPAAPAAARQAAAARSSCALGGDGYTGESCRLHAAAAAAAALTGAPLHTGSSPDVRGRPGGANGAARSSGGASVPTTPPALPPGAAACCTPAAAWPLLPAPHELHSPDAAGAEPAAGAPAPRPDPRQRGRADGAPGAGGLWEEAAGLVATLAARFGVAPGELGAGERVALIGVVLQTWQGLQQDANAREAAWQRERANELRGAAAAAAAAAADAKARRGAAEAAERQLRRFRAALGDGLPFGVAAMLGAYAAGAARLGLLAPLLRRCRPLAALGPLRPARPWALLEAAGVAACWAGAAGDLALAAAALLGGGWLVARAGLLAGEPHARPLVRIGLGLGAGAGGAGYFAVGRVGGDAAAWLAAWEAWLALHLLAAWAAPSALAWLQAAGAPRAGGARAPAGWGAAGAAGLLAYHAAMAVVLPVLVGAAPFRGRLSPQELIGGVLRQLLRARPALAG